MMHNKETPTYETRPFKSVAQEPGVLQKRFQKHACQKLTVRLAYSDLVNGKLSFTVNPKLLEELPDEVYVGCESFALYTTSDLSASDTMVANIESPFFTNSRQYLYTTTNPSYSPIIASIPLNYTTITSSVNGYSWQQQVLDNGLGCYTTNKQLLNNFQIPFTITDQTGATIAISDGGNLQFTLVFYGLNDDERYSMIPKGTYF